MYRILSIDGGGVYGAISTVIIERLVKKFPNLIRDTDLIAGTSIGAAVGLLIAKGVSMTEIKKIFPVASETIFSRGKLRTLLGTIGLKAFYSNENWKKIVRSYFGDTTLGQLNKKVMVPAFKLDNESTPRHWKAQFFHNFEYLEGTNPSRGEKALDVIMATTAAPVYFPVYNNMADGSLVENNPSMCAVAQTQDEKVKLNPRPMLKDICLLSLGRAGSKFLEGNGKDWGYLAWTKPMIYINLDRDSNVVHYQTEKLLGKEYLRIAPLLPEDLENGIDAWDKVPDLIKFAEKVDLSESEKWIEKHWSS